MSFHESTTPTKQDSLSEILKTYGDNALGWKHDHDYDWSDIYLSIDKSESFSEDACACWYKLPKAGDIAGMITICTPKPCVVQLMIAGEIKWMANMKSNQTRILPMAINMIRLGYHDAMVRVHGTDAIVTARYRLFTVKDIHKRKEMADVSTTSPDWYKVHQPEEWKMQMDLTQDKARHDTFYLARHMRGKVPELDENYIEKYIPHELLKKIETMNDSTDEDGFWWSPDRVMATKTNDTKKPVILIVIVIATNLLGQVKVIDIDSREIKTISSSKLL
jgi:hypothetical protein